MNTKNFWKVFSHSSATISVVETVLCAIAAACYLWILTTENGPGISPDSIDYYSTAQNFAQGKGMVMFDGERLTIFPVGYPLFLSACYSVFTSVSFLKWSCWLLSGLLFITLLLVGYALHQILQPNTALFIGMMIWAACHYWLYDVFTMVWSETLFIPLSLLGIICFYNYYQRPSFIKLLTTACLIAYCCITRFSGVAFAGSMILMLLFHKHMNIRKRIAHATLFTLICALPLVINLWQNAQVTGHFTGIRQPSETSWWMNSGLCFHTFLNWLFFVPITPNTFSNIAGSILFLITFYYTCRCLLKKECLNFSDIFLIAGTAYWAIMLLTASISKYEPLNNRLLFPAFLPFMIGSLGQFGRWMNMLQESNAISVKRGKQWLFIILCISLISQLKENNAFAEEVKEDGIPGYTEKGLAEENGMIGYFTSNNWRNQIDTTLPVFSNSYETVYFFAGIPCQTLPEFMHVAEKKHYQILKQLHYLVWFNHDYARTAIPNPNSYKQYQSIDTVFACSNGYILKVE